MNRCVCVYFCRKCCPGQIWSCIFTRCYLPWTSCQVPVLRLLYTVGHQRSKYSLYPGKQAEVVKNKTSWSAKLDTFISFAHTDDPFPFFSTGSSWGHRPSWRWPIRWELPRTGLPSPRLWFALVCSSRWNQCTRSRKSLQPWVWMLRIMMKFDWETIWQLLSDKSVCRAIKNDSLHKSHSPGSQLGVRHSRPAGKSSQFCLKDYVFIHILDGSEEALVLTNMLFERPNYCCNHPHSSARVNADPVQVSWVGGEMPFVICHCDTFHKCILVLCYIVYCGHMEVEEDGKMIATYDTFLEILDR